MKKVSFVLLAVFSDTHGNVEPMKRAVLSWAPDVVLHLGDYSRDADWLRGQFPDLDIRSVRGNCDLGSAAPDKLELEWEGVKLLATHGHLYNVKYTLDPLMNAAYFSGAKLALYGHTHFSEYREEGGIMFLNPGSAGTGSRPSAALITLEKGTAACRIVKMPGGWL